MQVSRNSEPWPCIWGPLLWGWCCLHTLPALLLTTALKVGTRKAFPKEETRVQGGSGQGRKRHVGVALLCCQTISRPLFVQRKDLEP